MSAKQPLPNSSDLDDEAEQAWADVEAALSDMQESSRQLVEAWGEFYSGAVDAEIHDDAPLKLEDAICLPELAGVFTVNPEFREQSASLSVKTLRGAIERGELAVIRPNSKNLYVTRKGIQEWLERCQDQRNPPTSFSERNAGTRTVASPTKRHGSLKTEKIRSAQDAALMTLSALKKPSKNT